MTKKPSIFTDETRTDRSISTRKCMVEVLHWLSRADLGAAVLVNQRLAWLVLSREDTLALPLLETWICIKCQRTGSYNVSTLDLELPAKYRC